MFPGVGENFKDLNYSNYTPTIDESLSEIGYGSWWGATAKHGWSSSPVRQLPFKSLVRGIYSSENFQFLGYILH